MPKIASLPNHVSIQWYLNWGRLRVQARAWCPASKDFLIGDAGEMESGSIENARELAIKRLNEAWDNRHA